MYLGKRENTPAIEVASQHAPCRGDLITVMLPPSIVVDDIGERDTANRPEPAHRIADRQQGIGVDVRRQAKRGLRFLLELQLKRGQSRAKAERSRRQ